MPEQRKFAATILLRPLLGLTRNDLREYAVANKLVWIEDESNENIGLDRNYIRHKLLPTIMQRWPAALQTMLRVTNNCAAAQELLIDLARDDYQEILGAQPNTIAISKLLKLSESRQNNVIRYWLQQLNLPTPSNVKLTHVHHDVLQCRIDANPCVHWDGAEVRRYRDDLYAMPPLSPHDPNIVIPWDGKSVLKLPNNLGVLKPELLNKLGIATVENLTVIFRHAGEPAGLKKQFQELGIPPWMRERTPILCADEKSLCIIP